MALQHLTWAARPCLLETILPVQKISAESYKEQMAAAGKTLTALGSYWKGRKPLILNKACVLGALLPVSEEPLNDLHIFDLLMGMDRDAMRRRLAAKLPKTKHGDIDELLSLPYHEQVNLAARPEELGEDFFAGIWDEVNAHLGTDAHSFPELVEQIGIARFGHRPRVADVFSGSGQIPFEAARLGCDVYASDLNPIACMLTWADFNIVGASEENHQKLVKGQELLTEHIRTKIDDLGFELDGKGWRAKAFLYCVEARCPESGWMIPLLPSLIVSKGYKVVARLVPLPEEKRYAIEIINNATPQQMKEAQVGTIQKGDISHSPDGITTYRCSMKSLRGDFTDEAGKSRNKLRLWEKEDFVPRPDDILQEKLYCIQWMKAKGKSSYDYEFRSVCQEDEEREQAVIDYVGKNLTDWQEYGYVPDMVIEKGAETERLYKERGWTHWHHLFNPRQLLTGALAKQEIHAQLSTAFCQSLNWNARLSHWSPSDGGGGAVKQVFYNQALNTFYNYGCRAIEYSRSLFEQNFKNFPLEVKCTVKCHPAQALEEENDIYITDPPYGDAVKYEEITEFFIAWLRKNPPAEFADWVWDSRRSLAIKGEDEGFRQGMIAAYAKMAEKMPDNGVQVLMFTHQSGSIWADMASIIWAAGLQVTAAWYIVTETDSALRQGSNVKGTVILILRKRAQGTMTFSDDLGWELQGAVKDHVDKLIQLDRQVQETQSEALYSDADLQMAGYAAAMKVLTAYSTIDGKDMMREAAAPRHGAGNDTISELIKFAVETAVQFLIPHGISQSLWEALSPAEKFYLKMLETEARGDNTLDNYQNFGKAFKVRDMAALKSDTSKANAVHMKMADELGRAQMSSDNELGNTKLRALLYALHELGKEVDTELVLFHLAENCPTYMNAKGDLVQIAEYIAKKRREQGQNAKNGESYLKEANLASILAQALHAQKL